MKKRSILSVLLALVLVLSVTTPAIAATKSATKTVTFNSYDSKYVNAPVTVKITNVTSQKTKDFSLVVSDGSTITGTKSKVITCKAPATITLQPNKGEKHAGFFNINLDFDTTKISPDSLKVKEKFYAFDADKNVFNFSKKYTSAPDGQYGLADGFSLTMTKPGKYVLYVKSVNDVDDETVDLTPVFIVVK